MTDEEKVRQVLAWADDKQLFYREALYIRPKKGGLASFTPRDIQLDTNDLIHRHRRVKITKARQLGITTGALADKFHAALFRPYTRVAMAAQLATTANEIFQIVATFYEFLPSWMKAIRLFKTRQDNANTLHLNNGSVVKVGTANTQFWRGQTYQHAHLTEAAFYHDFTKVLGSLGQAVSDTGTITFETTANGRNKYYDFWNDQDNGYHPVFYPWTLDPQYVHHALPDNLTKLEREYIERYELPYERAAWFVRTLREKCGNDLNLFNQEMPITADVAFIATGAKYFQVTFDVPDAYDDGLQVYVQPNPGHNYVIGADPASGAPTGDKSAAVVLDCVTSTVVATYNDRLPIPAFAEAVDLLSQRYNRALVNPEVNNHGHALIQDLLRRNTPLFRQSTFNGKVVHYANQFGTLLTEKSRNHLLSQMLSAIATGKLVTKCPRVQAQCNTFVYDNTNKPRASAGRYDDLVIATAHALYASATMAKPEPPPPQPETVRETLEWELRNGRLYA